MRSEAQHGDVTTRRQGAVKVGPCIEAMSVDTGWQARGVDLYPSSVCTSANPPAEHGSSGFPPLRARMACFRRSGDGMLKFGMSQSSSVNPEEMPLPKLGACRTPFEATTRLASVPKETPTCSIWQAPVPNMTTRLADRRGASVCGLHLYRHAFTGISGNCCLF